ncbi:MAG: hypothetical protein Q6373_003235 [Candidatus Sigynarchaeota archaeon]
MMINLIHVVTIDGARDIINKLGGTLDIEKEAVIMARLHDEETAEVSNRWQALKTKR